MGPFFGTVAPWVNREVKVFCFGERMLVKECFMEVEFRYVSCIPGHNAEFLLEPKLKVGKGRLY